MSMLEGQTAIVTGAAQGLGAAFARRLAAEQCNVVVTDQQERVHEIAREIAGLGFVGDVADPTHVREVVDATNERYGKIDILVNNAGEVKPTHPFDKWEHAVADYDRIMGSNTRGHYLYGRAVAPIMAAGGGGNIVNISTDHVKPGPGCERHHGHGLMDVYNASKWALNGLTFDWAKTLGPEGIRVNNICMGATDTEMLRSFLGADPDPEYLSTWMKPQETAQILVELLEEGPDGRTANSIGLYAGESCVMPPVEPET